MSLSEIIIAQIKNEGPISFHDFMEHSLYYPSLGYYTSSKEQIGQHGDFYTSSSITPVFGAMIGRQIQQMWKISGEKEFMIVEYGAGTGLLCHDILNYFKKYTDLYDQLQYVIIEKSPVMKERQKKHLKDKVTWYDNAMEIGGITGCILSNELLDNFSVHQVVMEDELMEIFVDYQDGFIEVPLPANETLKHYLAELDVRLPREFRTEINLEAVKWIRELSACLVKGFIITIDYGGTTAELYGSRKRRGTLMCYNKHVANENPYTEIGNQDITAHVNFSALAHWGLKYQLEHCGYTDQAHFLLSLGFKEWLRKSLTGDPDIISMVKKESRITHLMLVDMGNKFKVLIQRKGVPDIPLLGFEMSLFPL